MGIFSDITAQKKSIFSDVSGPTVQPSVIAKPKNPTASPTAESTPTTVAPMKSPVTALGNLVSEIFPGLRVHVGKLTGEDTTPYQEKLVEKQKSMTAPLLAKREDGTLALDPKAAEGRINLVAGFIGGEDLVGALETLAKEKAPGVVSSILKKSFPHLNEQAITSLAPKIADATTPAEVNALIKGAEEGLTTSKAIEAGSEKNGLLKGSEVPAAQIEQPSQLPKEKQLPQTEPIRPEPVSSSALPDGSNKVITPQADLGINVDNFNIDDAAKKLITNTVDELKPVLETKVGGVLSNAEVLKTAEHSSDLLGRAISSEQTKEWEVAMLNLRQRIAKAAEEGAVTPELINDLKVLKTQGSDIARKLQSLSIDAEAKTPQQALISSVLDVVDNSDEVIRAAQGVDFNDFNQAAAFYRKFVEPKASEWLDLLRYNSMLSSPKTHIVNAFSNAINTSIIAPLTRAVEGNFDFLASKFTGRDQQVFSKEAGAYLKAYAKNLRNASKNFGEVMAGKKGITQLDVRAVPLAVEGVKGKVASTLSYPLRLLEASDQFFSTLAEAGETAALQYRKGKGVSVPLLEAKAKDTAAYYLYRHDLRPQGQGTMLNAIDELTGQLMRLRSSENPIVSMISKFTVPFVKTPTNLFKQGLEFSPLGLGTLPGAENKIQQLAKTAIGTSVFGAAATLLASDRLTFNEPTNEREKNLWRAAGKQPYSIKIGDKWVSYQKLPPPLAFPFAMVGALQGAVRDKKIDDNGVDLVLSSIAKYGEFLSDQSYAKSIGDLFSAFQQGESSIARLISNYPQQLIPYRALTGWMARLFDDIQRKPDPNGTFVDKQMQLLMMNYPGLSQKTPARINEVGEEIHQKNKYWNAFSPVSATTEDPNFAKFLGNYEKYSVLSRREAEKTDAIKEKAKGIYSEFSKLDPAEANAKAAALKKNDPRTFGYLKDLVEADKLNYNQEEKYIKSLGVENGLRAQYIWDDLQRLKTDQEKNAYIKRLQDKRIITSDVVTQLRQLKNAQ